ncbi:MFS transporter [soil metagenome]
MSRRTGEKRVDPPPLRRDHRVHTWVAARGISETGDTVWLIALAWTAVHVAGPAQAGLLVGLGTLPRAALMLFGGVLADRWDNRRTVLVANFARVLVQVVGVVLLTVVDGHVFSILAGVAVTFGLADAIHNPASGTMARQMVRPDDLRAVVAMFQTVGRLARLLGAPLGGVLVAAFDLRVAMLVDAVSFAAIGVVYVLWMHPRFPRVMSTGSSVRRDLVAGLGYLRRTPDVRSLVVTQQGWGAHTLGLLEACVGAGAAIGAIGAARSKTARPAVVGFAILVAQGFGIAGLGFGNAVLTGVAAAFVGVTAGAASTYISALFLVTVHETFLGRMQSVTSLVDDGLMPAAMAGFGLLAGLTSVATACLVAGSGMSLLCAVTGRRVAAGERFCQTSVQSSGQSSGQPSGRPSGRPSVQPTV